MNYVFPQLAGVYAALGPWAEALLRVTVALCLMPHGLQNCFGLFPNSGSHVSSARELAGMLEKVGYRPGALWGPVIIFTELVLAPMLALGLFTRLVSIPVVILLLLSIREHSKFGWFWAKQGAEYPVIWSAAAIYFLVNGGGAISLDRLIGWEF